MNPQIRAIWDFSCKVCAVLALFCAGAALFLWPQPHPQMAALGILFGACIGQFGLYLICTSVNSLSQDAKAEKQRAFTGYLLRYAIYAAAAFAGVFAGIPVLSILAGFLCAKGSLLVYSYINGKDKT